MRLGGDVFEPIDEVRRIRARARAIARCPQVVAIERRGIARRRVDARPRGGVTLEGQLRAPPTPPRRAASNCSGVTRVSPGPLRHAEHAPRDRGPEWRASPETAAAIAASSSSRSSVSRGARAARAISAAWTRGVSATAGASGGTSAGRARGRPRLVDDQGGRRDVAEALVVAPQQHADDGKAKTKRQEIGDAQQVARDRRRRRHGQSVVHDDLEVEHALARRRAGARSSNTIG